MECAKGIGKRNIYFFFSIRIFLFLTCGKSAQKTIAKVWQRTFKTSFSNQTPLLYIFFSSISLFCHEFKTTENKIIHTRQPRHVHNYALIFFLSSTQAKEKKNKNNERETYICNDFLLLYSHFVLVSITKGNVQRTR